MDANVLDQAEELAKSIAGQATTMEDLNGVMRTLMKSALEQMLGAELKVHLKEEHATDRARSRSKGTSASWRSMYPAIVKVRLTPNWFPSASVV